MNANETLIPAGRDGRLLKMREGVLERMSTYALSKRLPGETEEQAFYRLAKANDPTILEQYRLHAEIRELM